VAQAGFQAVPARRQRPGEVADVLVVHAQHRSEPVRLHALPRPLGAVLPHAIPIDSLLPVETRDSEVRSHVRSRVERDVSFEKGRHSRPRRERSSQGPQALGALNRGSRWKMCCRVTRIHGWNPKITDLYEATLTKTGTSEEL